MISHRCQDNLTFSTIKNGAKEHIRHCLLFYFHQKKSAANAHKIICETYKNVITIRMYVNLNDLKRISIFVKDRSRHCCGRGIAGSWEKVGK